MARFDTSGLDPAVRYLEKMEMTTGALADSMLIAGAKAVQEAWREAAERHGHRLTGQLIESIGYPRKPRTVGDVRSIDIYPQGTDDKGVRNAEKAFVLHYGSRSRPGSRWIDTADAISGETAVPAMLKVFDDYMRTLNA